LGPGEEKKADKGISLFRSKDTPQRYWTVTSWPRDVSADSEIGRGIPIPGSVSAAGNFYHTGITSIHAF
jgi:hypothetical protein